MPVHLSICPVWAESYLMEIQKENLSCLNKLYASIFMKMQPVAVSMTSDYLFKALLQKNRHVLKALICALLHWDPENINELSITNPIIIGESITDKDVVLDVNVLFDNGAHIDLEMQVVNHFNWPERSLYYACRNFTSLQVNGDYKSVPPSLQIGFVDYTPFKDHPVFYNTYYVMDETGYHYTDKLSIGVVDLTLIHLATEEDRRYNIDKWAQLFKSRSWEDVKMLARQNIDIENAATTIYELSEDERFRQECEARADRLRNERDMQLHQEELERQLEEAREQLAKQGRLIEELQEQLKKRS